MKGNKKIFIIIGVSAAILVGGIWLLTDGGGSDSDSGRDSGKSRPSILERMGLMAPEKALEDYIEQSVYPPNSRPLSDKNEDLLHPNARYENLMPIEEGSSIYYLFTADKYHVVGNESITFVLRAQDGNSKNAEKVPVTVHLARITKGHDPKKATFAANLPLAPDDTGTLTCEFVPASALPSQTASARFNAEVKFTAAGEEAEISIPFEYFPEPTIPARFTGSFTEEVKDGSLYINAGIEVFHPGFFISNANLFDTKGEPVAYSIAKLELGRGHTRVPLLFFGKVLRDSSSKPPYVLKNLRGYRFIEVTVPDPELMDRELIRDYDKDHVTRAYSKNSFSDKEWESEEKERRQKFLEKETIEAYE